jgi:hypothetical protein
VLALPEAALTLGVGAVGIAPLSFTLPLQEAQLREQ